MSITKDKVRGMFLGVAIGDALGMPVETMSAGAIEKEYGRMTEYVKAPDHHKFLAGYPAGKWTDDTQLTLTVAESIITCGGINMDHIAQAHVCALDKTESGWGRSTTEAVLRIASGVPWSDSGKTNKKNRGKGNGVAMKATPLLLPSLRDMSREELGRNFERIVQFARMTHDSNMAVLSGFIQALGVRFIMHQDHKKWNQFLAKDFVDVIKYFMAKKGLSISVTLTKEQRNEIIETVSSYALPSEGEDDLMERFGKMANMQRQILHMSDQEICEYFGTGSCYVYESLPVVYALFLRRKGSIEAMYDAVNFGGDTDTVASMVGALIGAFHGASVFPQHLVANLYRKDYILDVADRFCAAFSILDS